MSTAAQILANRQNAQASTGPVTAEGIITSSLNARVLGLFTLTDYVRPEEQVEYELHCAALWGELNTSTPLQRTFAAEIVKAAWRLRRCSLIENGFHSDIDPMQNEATARLQTSVDRARAQAHNVLRRSLAELRRLQADPIVVETKPVETKPAETKSVEAKPAQPEITNRTQSAPRPTPAAAQTTNATPRNAACPCGSGIKYKRCCGTHAPAVPHTKSPAVVHPVHGHSQSLLAS